MNISIGEKKVFGGAAPRYKRLKYYRRCRGVIVSKEEGPTNEKRFGYKPKIPFLYKSLKLGPVVMATKSYRKLSLGYKPFINHGLIFKTFLYNYWRLCCHRKPP